MKLASKVVFDPLADRDQAAFLGVSLEVCLSTNSIFFLSP